MYRIISVVSILLCTPELCGAASPKGPTGPTEQVTKLAIVPMAEPVPALKYQLLPELSEMSAGNPVQGYLTCFAEGSKSLFGTQEDDAREKWSDMPLDQLPLDKLRNYGGSILKQADYAARLDTLDWQLLPGLKREGILLAIPEVTSMREIARALYARFRAQVAARDFDGAIATAKTLFAMSRNLNEHPTIVGNLIGLSILSLAVAPLEEMIQQTGSPNLYWALTALPSPIVGLGNGIRGERAIMGHEFTPLEEHIPMSNSELQSFLDRTDALFGAFGGPRIAKGAVREFVERRAKDPAALSAARTRLSRAGIKAETINLLSPAQVILLDEVKLFQQQQDDILKEMSLPFWQIKRSLVNEPPDRDDGLREGHLFSSMLLPIGAKKAEARWERAIAMLRCVEALRLYAADHDGRLPASLADVPVPVPVDPITGKAFQYHLGGSTAVLRGAGPPGMEADPLFNRVYQITTKR